MRLQCFTVMIVGSSEATATARRAVAPSAAAGAGARRTVSGAASFARACGVMLLGTVAVAAIGAPA